MTTSTLPTVIDEYFDLMDSEDKAGVVDLFVPDARVTDNATTYRGHQEIARWLAGEASEYTTTSTRLSAERTDEHVVVVVRVEGSFPGGRVDLRASFELDAAERIRTLTITA